MRAFASLCHRVWSPLLTRLLYTKLPLQAPPILVAINKKMTRTLQNADDDTGKSKTTWRTLFKVRPHQVALPEDQYPLQGYNGLLLRLFLRGDVIAHLFDKKL